MLRWFLRQVVFIAIIGGLLLILFGDWIGVDINLSVPNLRDWTFIKMTPAD